MYLSHEPILVWECVERTTGGCEHREVTFTGGILEAGYLRRRTLSFQLLSPTTSYGVWYIQDLQSVDICGVSN